MRPSFIQTKRLRAFLLHLVTSIIVAGSFSLVTMLCWYPQPLLTLQGGMSIIAILLAVDTILGPAMTLLIFAPHKSRRELTLDIALISIIQGSAFAYGANVIYQERPQYLVFAGTQFFVVKFGESTGIENTAVASAQRYGTLGPKIVYAAIPKEHVTSGAALIAGIQGDPTFALDAANYRPLEAHVNDIAKEALDPSEITPLLTGDAKTTTNHLEDFLYFPIKGRSKTAIAIVSRASGHLEHIHLPADN